MTKTAYLWGVRGVTLLALGGLLAIVTGLDPNVISTGGQFVFYLLLALTLTGIVNLFLFSLRKRKATSEAEKLAVLGISLRHGMIIAISVSGALLLQQQRMLVWWTALLLLATAFLVELYFLTR